MIFGFRVSVVGVDLCQFALVFWLASLCGWVVLRECGVGVVVLRFSFCFCGWRYGLCLHSVFVWFDFGCVG